MIDVRVENGEVNIKEMAGNGFKMMSELCCIVAACCEAYTEDITDGSAKILKSEMIKKVADALKWGENNRVLENDENADF